jgi:phosphatidate phosphatase APP1
VDRRRLDSVSLLVVLAIEDTVHAVLVRLIGLSGRRDVTVLPYIGHGTPRQVRARGRVVLGRTLTPSAAAELVAADGPTPKSPALASGASGPATPGGGRWRRRIENTRRTWRVLRGSLGPFLTVELPRTPVRVRGPRGLTFGRCDRQGYLDVPVDAAGLAPGWHEVSVETSWRGASAAVPIPVLVLDPQSRVAVISDLDDTVIETGITRGLEFLRLTLLTSVSDRTPLPGAADLYRALTARRGGPHRPVFYLSTSPWNLYELLARFLVLRGFPAGPLLLTDWGPSRTNLFRVDAEQHKLTLIRQVLAEHPALGVVLIGDTGQLDPEIYATVARESPDRVRAVYLRRTAGMSAARALEVGRLARSTDEVGVPMLMVESSVQIAEHAADLGLIDPAAVPGIRRASQ